MSSRNDRYAPKPPRLPSERPGPVGGKRDANRRKRIQQLCQASLGLFLDRGIEAVTIDEIVREAGVAKASFYRYFRDKTEVVATLFEPLRTTLGDAMTRCEAALTKAEADTEKITEAYQVLGTDFATLMMTMPRELLLYLQESRAPGVRARAPLRDLADEIDARALELTEVARQHGLWRPIDPRVSTLVVVGAAERLLLGVLRGEELGAIASVPAQVADLILNGLGAD